MKTWPEVAALIIKWLVSNFTSLPLGNWQGSELGWKWEGRGDGAPCFWTGRDVGRKIFQTGRRWPSPTKNSVSRQLDTSFPLPSHFLPTSLLFLVWRIQLSQKKKNKIKQKCIFENMQNIYKQTKSSNLRLTYRHFCLTDKSCQVVATAETIFYSQVQNM